MMMNKSPHQILDEIAREHIPHDINLSAGTIAKIRKEDKNMMKSKLFVSLCIVIALLLVVLFTVPEVVLVMQRLFGYVPGTGLVAQSQPLRILKTPVEMTFAETTIKVDQAMIDAEHTILTVQIENLPFQDSTEERSRLDDCHEFPILRLADGTELTGTSETGVIWRTGYRRRYIYPALPIEINTAILAFPCLEFTPREAIDQKMEVLLEFIPAPPELTVLPMQDFPTPTVAPTSTTAPQGSEDSPSGIPIAADFRLSLSKYIQTSDNIILFGSLQSVSNAIRITMVDSMSVHLVDSSGVDIPLEVDYSLDDTQPLDGNDKSFQLVYQSATKYSPGMAEFSIDSAWIMLEADTQFEFDPGVNPQPGQVWQLNESLEIAGYPIVIKSAQMSTVGNGFTFEIDAPAEVSTVSVMDFEHPMLGGGGGPGSYGFNYPGDMPQGILKLTIPGIEVLINGPWKTKIDLPAFSEGEPAVVLPDACLTKETWATALTENTNVLPPGMNGTLMLSTLVGPPYEYWAIISELDGSNQVKLGKAESSNLSPDGSQVIYSTDDGLLIADLDSGTKAKVQETTKRDRGAIWSPDGSRIVFTRGPASGLNGGPGPYSLMMVNSEGSKITTLLQNNDANFAQAWMPDGNSILYAVETPDGRAIRRINPDNGEINQLFTIQYSNAGVSISPDGQRVAYEDYLPGERYAVFTANLDGSEPKLIANPYPHVATSPQWSPDGRWLILSMQDQTISEVNPVLALIDLDTCRIIPLRNMEGYVDNWIP